MFDHIYQGKRVLVTGHTGFKGSWLSLWLLRLGAKVAGYSLTLPTQPSLYETLELEQDLEHCIGDIRDDEALLACCQAVKPDIVFHLAAQPLVRESYRSPKLTFDTNSGGAVNMLEAIRQCTSVRAAVIVTSDKCYQNDGLGVPFSETAPLGGQDPYSASKACAELITHAYIKAYFNESGVRIATARAGNVIGGGDWADDRLVPDIIRAWSLDKPLSIRHPQAIRPWQHILEPISGYLWLGAKLFADPQFDCTAVNFGPDKEAICTVGDMVERFRGCFPELTIHVVNQTNHLHSEAKVLQLDSAKAHNILNWRAILTIDQRVFLTSQWYLRYYANDGDIRRLTDEQIEAYQIEAAQCGQPWAVVQQFPF